MLKSARYLIVTAIAVGLVGCAAPNGKFGTADDPAPVVDALPSGTHLPEDVQKIAELERQLAREQRQCHSDKRRLEGALKESQKQNEELQKKIDALLAIDRDLRNRRRTR